MSANIDQLVSEKLNKYVTENQEDLKGQSISIASHEFDKNGNLNITFSDETSIQIPKGKDGRNGENGRDGQSTTTITERGTNDNRNGVFIRTYKVDHEGIKQDLISETFVSDGRDGSNGQDGKQGKMVMTVKMVILSMLIMLNMMKMIIQLYISQMENLQLSKRYSR